MKINILGFLFVTSVLFGAVGCSSSEPAQASAEEKKQFGGGPPPADYMDAANKATEAARAGKNGAPGGTTAPP